MLIIKNYIGDILNFEIVIELLYESGIKVIIVVVDDDVVVKDSFYIVGCCGVVNIVLIEKLVGVVVECGDLLEVCVELGCCLNNFGYLIGIVFGVCIVLVVG